jgi:phage terminase small subunit
MGLTEKQELFCQEIVKGKTQIEAYKLAGYSTNNSDDTIYNNAYKLMQNNDIITRIQALKAPIEKELIKKFVKTKEDLLNEFELLKQMALDKDDLREARENCKEQGKMLGFYEESLKVKGELDLHNSLAIFKKRLEDKEKDKE